MIKIVAFAFLVVFLCLLLRQTGNGISFFLLVAGTIFLFMLAFEELKKLYSQMEQFMNRSAVIPIYLKQLLKILGITYLADFGASICKDAGYQTLGKQIEIIGKISILAMIIPLLLTVIDTVFQIL